MKEITNTLILQECYNREQSVSQGLKIQLFQFKKFYERASILSELLILWMLERCSPFSLTEGPIEL